MEFYEHLKQLRKQRGYTQQELAELLHVSRQAVSSWESGRTQPDIATIQTLCELYHISSDVLFMEKEEEDIPLRPHRILCLLHLGMLLIVVVYLAYQGYGIGSWLLSANYFLFHLLMYTLLMYCLRHHSYTILAGYDEEVTYKERSVRKLLSYMLFLLGTSSFFFTFLQLIVAISDQGWLFPYLFVCYIFEFCWSIVYANMKYQKDLYMDTHMVRYARSANKLTVAVLLSIAALTIALLLVFTIYAIPNNSPAAFRITGIVLLYLGVNIPWIVGESFRVQKLREDHPLYHFHPFIRFLIPFDMCMLLLLFWIGGIS